MAIVRFSATLKDQIKKNAGVYFDTKKDNILKSYPVNFGDKLYEFITRPYPELQTLPAGFFDTCGMIQIEVFCGVAPKKQFSLSSNKPFPHRWNTSDTSSSYYGHVVSFKSNRPPETSEEIEIYNELYRVECELIKVRESRAEFITALNNLLDRHTTLATALKEWQPLWDYLPQDAKNRHLEVAKREKKEVETFDPYVLSKMTAIAAVSKMVR